MWNIEMTKFLKPIEREMTDEEAADLGKHCRAAKDGNLLVGSFAAELIGQSYPFSKAMCKIIFSNYDDKTLGRKFAKWVDEKEDD